jgi:hypothetical protein
VDSLLPCGHFSGGRGSWWRFHLLGNAAKEETMNIREAAAKFKTDEDCLTYQEQMRWSHEKRGLFIFRGFAHDAEGLRLFHRLALVYVDLCLNAIALELRIAKFRYADGRGLCFTIRSLHLGIIAV